jgi:hypothetical protein
VPFGNSLGETFNDGSLTDSRFSDETWIVFCFTIKDGYESFDFFVSSDDDIDFPSLSFSGKIDTEEIERRSQTLFFFSSGYFLIDSKR